MGRFSIFEDVERDGVIDMQAKNCNKDILMETVIKLASLKYSKHN